MGAAYFGWILSERCPYGNTTAVNVGREEPPLTPNPHTITLKEQLKEIETMKKLLKKKKKKDNVIQKAIDTAFDPSYKPEMTEEEWAKMLQESDAQQHFNQYQELDNVNPE